jgi:DMSO/TMAO reductase YedYZ molybdopterin-dependent catalytic subunit
MTMLDALPKHPVPGAARAASTQPELTVAGMVERPLRLALADVAALPRVSWDGDFGCEEGWTVPDLHWEGVRLADVIDRARPLEGARFVQVASGSFVLPLPMEDARRAVLCDVLDGRPLALEHGAPWRLLLPGGACFTSVKWVDRIELMATPADNTAESIARARLRSQPG